MKVLVLTRSTGEGHNHAAHAMTQAFTDRGHTCDTQDALRVWQAGRALIEPGHPANVTPPTDSPAPHPIHRADPAPDSPTTSRRPDSPATSRQLDSPAASRTSEASAVAHRTEDVAAKLYGWVAYRLPRFFGVVYTAGDLWSASHVPSPVYYQNQKYAAATHAYISHRGYDVVVATHLFPHLTLSAVRRRYPSATRYYGVMTDYSIQPFFSEARVDGYFIPHPDMMASCVRRGLPRDRTFAYGLPVLTAFRDPAPRADARTELGLPPGATTYLVMSGGVGSVYTKEVCDRLLSRADEHTQVVILTGRREDFFTAIAGRYRDDKRVRVVPYTDRVPTYMAAADCLITKPGGVSSTEAAVMGLPLIHTGAIAGNETRNARFFADRGLSLYVPQAGEAGEVAHHLVCDSAALVAMRAAQAAQMLPDAAESIVARIEGTTR